MGDGAFGQAGEGMTQFELGTDCQTQLADARVKIETLQMHKAALQAQCDSFVDDRAVANRELDKLTAQLAEARAQRKLDVMTIAAQADVIDERNAQIAALAEAEAELAKLKPYALATIGQLRLASIAEELADAEDEEERRAVACEQSAWENTALRLVNLMRDRWERDRKTMVRCELANMAEAASK